MMMRRGFERAEKGKEAGQGSEVQELLSGRVEELEGVQVWVCGWLRR